MQINLINGGITTVDDQDSDLSQFSWSKTKRGRVVRKEPHGIVKLNKVIAQRMGIVGEVDHADGDGFNNQRRNLRAATRSENNSNRQKFSNGSPASKYKGVQFTHGKWAAQIQKDGNRKWLGRFKHEDSAAKAYDIAAKELHGEFAVLNFPEDNAALADMKNECADVMDKHEQQMYENHEKDVSALIESHAAKTLSLRQQLIRALAAIAEHNRHCDQLPRDGTYSATTFTIDTVDISALDKRDREQQRFGREEGRADERENRKPLVDALEELKDFFAPDDQGTDIINEALAKAKQ